MLTSGLHMYTYLSTGIHMHTYINTYRHHTRASTQ